MTLNIQGGHLFGRSCGDALSGPLVEVDRVETGDVSEVLAFLTDLGLAGELAGQRGELVVRLLLGASACASLGGVPLPRPSPSTVPECVAVAYRRGTSPEPTWGAASVGQWEASWTEVEHAQAVRVVQAAIAAGSVYQANVVGHQLAPYVGDEQALAAAVAALPGARYGGVLAGEGWAVGSASPEQLVRVTGDRITTIPIKGTARDAGVLRESGKDRAEHVMIVDLERNDLARVTVAGSVEVEELYALAEWNGLWHASSTVAGRLAPGVGTLDVLRALAPGGSVTGAPKHAACGVLADLEPVGRGPAMGALGWVWPGGLDLGLTIRTVAAADGQVHLWAGGGITWSSDPADEVAEAAAKAAPVRAALAQVRPCDS